MVESLTASQKTWVESLGREDGLVKEMAAHCSILGWRSPWMRSLVGYSPRAHKESDRTEWLTLTKHTHVYIYSYVYIDMYALLQYIYIYWNGLCNFHINLYYIHMSHLIIIIVTYIENWDFQHLYYPLRYFHCTC